MDKLRNNITTCIILALILIGFNFIISRPLPTYKILKVKAADEFFIDFNKNNKIDEHELVKLYDINVFKPEKNNQTKFQTQNTGLTTTQALGLGILADNFAQKIFEGKNVRVKFLDIEAHKNHKTLRAKLYLNNKEISQILLENGFAVYGTKEPIYKTYLSYINLFKNRNKLDTENIIILNTQNNIFHSIDCNYANGLNNAKAYRKNNLPKNTKPCPHCLLRQEFTEKNIIDKTFKIRDFDFTSGVLSFYFTDFNKRQKPDNTCQNAGCKALLKEINNAKESIDFAIYGISNQPKIINALIAAQNRGVKIRWVTDADTKGRNIYEEVATVQKQLPNFKTDNHFIQGETNKNSKYTNAIMHNKFFIFDKKTLWTGSANISQTDLADFNANIIVLAKSKSLVNIYQQEFDQMYNEKFHNLKTKIPNKENLKIDNQNLVSVYFSPTDKIITSKIVPMINNAQNYIYISSFIITHHAIKSALIYAQSRGVEIKIITDATSANGRYSIHKELRNNHIGLKVENKAGKMHSKALIIDDKYSIIGSLNLTKSGDYKNDENIILIQNPTVAKTFKTQFLYLWNSIPNLWLTHTPRAESPESIGSCSDGIDNDFDGLIDKDDTACQALKK